MNPTPDEHLLDTSHLSTKSSPGFVVLRRQHQRHGRGHEGFTTSGLRRPQSAPAVEQAAAFGGALKYNFPLPDEDGEPMAVTPDEGISQFVCEAATAMDVVLAEKVVEALAEAHTRLAGYLAECSKLLDASTQSWGQALVHRLGAMTVEHVAQGALREAVRDARDHSRSLSSAQAIHAKSILFILSRAARIGEDLASPGHGRQVGPGANASVIDISFAAFSTSALSPGATSVASPGHGEGAEHEHDLTALNSSFSSALGLDDSRLAPSHPSASTSPTTPGQATARRFLGLPGSHGSHSAMSDTFKTPSPVALMVAQPEHRAALAASAVKAVAAAAAARTTQRVEAAEDSTSVNVHVPHRSYRGMLADTMLATPALNRSEPEA
jgi:hypothetical protein